MCAVGPVASADIRLIRRVPCPSTPRQKHVTMRARTRGTLRHRPTRRRTVPCQYDEDSRLPLRRPVAVPGSTRQHARRKLFARCRASRRCTTPHHAPTEISTAKRALRALIKTARGMATRARGPPCRYSSPGILQVRSAGVDPQRVPQRNNADPPMRPKASSTAIQIMVDTRRGGTKNQRDGAAHLPFPRSTPPMNQTQRADNRFSAGSHVPGFQISPSNRSHFQRETRPATGRTAGPRRPADRPAFAKPQPRRRTSCRLVRFGSSRSCTCHAAPSIAPRFCPKAKSSPSSLGARQRVLFHRAEACLRGQPNTTQQPASPEGETARQ